MLHTMLTKGLFFFYFQHLVRYLVLELEEMANWGMVTQRFVNGSFKKFLVINLKEYREHMPLLLL